MSIDHVSVQTAAKMLGVHVETLRRWIRSGKVAVIHFPSKQQRVTRAAIERLLQESTTKHSIPPHHRIH